ISRSCSVACALAAALLLCACGGGESAHGATAGPGGGGPRPPAVEVVTLAPESFRPRTALLGELRSVESVTVKPELAGVIESIGFEEGQSVTRGTVLFQLRDDEQGARLAEAVARAREERYRAELERTRIRAPFDGVVGARLVSPGARVTPDDALVRIDAVDPMELVFTIPEVSLPLARIGAPFELAVASYPGRTFQGTISFVAPTVDPANRRILIKGRVPNPERERLPGLLSTV